MEIECEMTSKKCGFCEKPIPRMQSRYYAIEGNERKQLCVFCYVRVMRQLQGQDERARQITEQMEAVLQKMQKGEA